MPKKSVVLGLNHIKIFLEFFLIQKENRTMIRKLIHGAKRTMSPLIPNTNCQIPSAFKITNKKHDNIEIKIFGPKQIIGFTNCITTY